MGYSYDLELAIFCLFISSYVRKYCFFLIRGNVFQMKIPDSCLPKQWPNNELPSVSYIPTSQHPNSADNSLGDSCFHSGSFYEDGAQWTSANEVKYRQPINFYLRNIGSMETSYAELKACIKSDLISLLALHNVFLSTSHSEM